MTYSAVTAIGRDRPGILAAISNRVESLVDDVFRRRSYREGPAPGQDMLAQEPKEGSEL